MATKAQIVKAYNRINPGYYITGVEKMSKGQVEARKEWGKSFDEMYKRPSDDKVASYRAILRRYEPKEIIAVTGGSQTYSVLLVAKNGSLLHITKSNNYLVEVV